MTSAKSILDQAYKYIEWAMFVNRLTTCQVAVIVVRAYRDFCAFHAFRLNNRLSSIHCQNA